MHIYIHTLAVRGVGRGGDRRVHNRAPIGQVPDFLYGDVCSLFPEFPESAYLVCPLRHMHISYFVTISVFDTYE